MLAHTIYLNKFPITAYSVFFYKIENGESAQVQAVSGVGLESVFLVLGRGLAHKVLELGLDLELEPRGLGLGAL